MPGEAPSSNPLDQLVELFVYAPVGLLYEYPEVIPKLVKRGRSQVQLARLVAQMAANQARAGGPGGRPGGLPPLDTLAAVLAPGLGEAAGAACNVLARLATDLGAAVGLAPQPPPAGEAARGAGPSGPAGAPSGPTAGPSEPEGGGPPEPSASAPPPDSGEEAGPLPIAGYDSLTAREVIGLLDDLSPRQRNLVRAHETANRGRKTILAKLDQLDAAG